MSTLSSTAKPGVLLPTRVPEARPHLVEKFGGDERASGLPCPMLSVLVNEGRLKPDADGRVSTDEMKAALRSVGITSATRHLLAHGGAQATEGSFFKKAINLLQLEGGSLDHEGSLGPLQGGGFNPEALERLKSFSKNGTGLTLDDLAVAQRVRMTEDGGALRDKTLGIVELSAILLVFGRVNAAGEKELRLEDLDTIYRDNRFPAGFEPKDVGLLDVTMASLKLAATQNTSSAAARAEKGLREALELPERVDATSMLGLGQMCPAGMRPKAGVGVTGGELSKLHEPLEP